MVSDFYIPTATLRVNRLEPFRIRQGVLSNGLFLFLTPLYFLNKAS